MIKKILLAVVAIAVVLVAAIIVAVMVTPTDFKAEREIVINKPRADVYDYVKYVKKQNDWGPWYKKEPTMKQEFRGNDGEVGFVSHWTGTTDSVGEGEQEIKRLVPNERVETELRFIKPFESKADAYIHLEDAGPSQTKVKWGFTGSMPRPMNLFLLVMDIDKEVGKDYAEGLSSLKAILESQ